MPIFEIICLANSYKNRGRCIAGLKTDGSGWLRPVSIQSDGTLYPNNYILDTNREPKLFDILEIECSHHCPAPHQPENWVITPKRWRFVSLPTLQKVSEILKPELDKNATLNYLFGNSLDSIEYEYLRQNPTPHSLAYVKPESITWMVEEYSGKKKYRAGFTLNNISYNLKITDPDWKSRMNHAGLPVGSYSSSEVIERLKLVDFSPECFRFTVSLGEPFTPNGDNQQYCFKLIAAVINTKPIRTQLTRAITQS